MKRLFLSLMMVLMSFAFVASEVEAKRFGGGGTSGMQRSMPARSTPNTPPNGQAPASPTAAPGMAPAGAAAAAAAPRRSWMGPIAGLAAGLGLAALFSHLGMGEGLANFVMIALLAVAAVFVVRFLMRKFAGNAAGGMASMNRGPGEMKFQGAGASPGSMDNVSARTDLSPSASAPAFGSSYMGSNAGTNAAGNTSSASGFGSGSAAAAAAAASIGTQTFTVPAGFDVPAFERIAKMIFIRMQAANDVGDLNDLRQFTTPELFASVRLELQERGNAPQQTDVVKLDTEVLDIARENGNQVVSVRFHGLIREEIGGVAAPFDEVWHLVKPEDGSREWAIAGIAQYA
ncbi:TIM44-like domain-containing protein [soil metagenome]